MPGRNFLATQTHRQSIQRGKLQPTVASNTGNRSLAIQVAVDERLDDSALEFLLEIKDIKRKAQFFGHAAGIVNIIERAATRGQWLAIFIDTETAALVPQLHREADQFVTLLL